MDTYDAITNDRPYRKTRSDAVARDEIRNGSGSQYDPKVVEAFLAIPYKEWIQAGWQNVKREMGATFVLPARVKNNTDEPETAVLEEFEVVVSCGMGDCLRGSLQPAVRFPAGDFVKGQNTSSYLSFYPDYLSNLIEPPNHRVCQRLLQFSFLVEDDWRRQTDQASLRRT